MRGSPSGQGTGSNDPGTAGSSPAPRVREPALYAVARADLDVGLRTAQVGHALIHWVLKHGRPPESLVVLAARDLDELHRIHDRLSACRAYAFHEPDRDDEMTALAVGPEARKLLSSLPLLR